MIFKIFRKETELEKTANSLYAAIVAQARQPVFYRDYHVEDSINGRFEMIVLHAYMLFHRLRGEDEKTRAVGQAVFDRFFMDMDDSLREMGVGDLSVPKKIKKMAEAFYGRVEAYDEARAQSGESLVAALSRNVFPEAGDIRPEAVKIADYLEETTRRFAAQDAQDIVACKLNFAPLTPVPAENAERDTDPDMGKAGPA